MEELLKKVSSYNIFNYLLPGTVFAVLGDRLTSFTLLQDDLLIALFLYYFFGLIISRVGSVVVQPILEKLHIVKPAPYSDYLDAQKSDEKIEERSEANNMYRTIASLFIFLLGLLLFDELTGHFSWLAESAVPVALILFLILFVLAYRKQTQYIVKRINKGKNQHD